MWQQLIAGVLVIVAAIYAARVLGPKRWRRRRSGAAAKVKGASGQCGCGKDDGCH